jgi:hypothetical protein
MFIVHSTSVFSSSGRKDSFVSSIQLILYLTDKMMDAGLPHVWMSRQPQPGFHKDQPGSRHQLSWILSLMR